MKKRLTVFLCSTYADLAGERERVLDAVRRLQLEHDSMEFFGARSGLPIETCLEEVRRSDVLVVIVGHRYGSIVPELGISFSEAEYREGHRLGKPCLVYVRDENAPVLLKNVERDPERLQLLESWKATLTQRHTIAPFSDPHALAVQVAADLSRTVQALEQAAAVRDTKPVQPRTSLTSDVESLLEEAIRAGISELVLAGVVRRAVADLLASSGRRPARVFLSYSHKDKRTVREVAEGLRAAGVDVWLDEAELNLGDLLITKIERGLDSADYVAFFLSNASMRSSRAQQELNVAISRQVSADRGAVILPVLLEDVEIPSLLRDVVYLDMRDGDVREGVTKLISSIRRHQLERGHTYQTNANRFFNPPGRVRDIGRQLTAGQFGDLAFQLREDEVLLALYRNQVDALVATHLHSRKRMDEMEEFYGPAEGYFALARRVANEGLDDKIPPNV
jgi:hypothetical protein